MILSWRIHARTHAVTIDPTRANQSYYVELICLSLCPVVGVAFWRSKRVARNCAQRMRPQGTGSNPLSGSIICPSVCPVVRPVVRGPFCDFCICILISTLGGPECRDAFISTSIKFGFQKYCFYVLRVSFWVSFWHPKPKCWNYLMVSVHEAIERF